MYLQISTMYLHLYLLIAAGYVAAQKERTTIGLFVPPVLGKATNLSKSLQLSCEQDGDKIRIKDIWYIKSGCENFQMTPKDPAADRNKENIDQCTGKRLCVVPADHVTKPFEPPNERKCGHINGYKIKVRYTCVPREQIRSMCESFITEERVGYLSSPSYPRLLMPGEPVAMCRCQMETVPPSARISLSLLEYNLVGNSSDADMNACQYEVYKQYLGVKGGGSDTYFLCGHKYNEQLASSSKVELTFDNPIMRTAGAFWLEYSADDEETVVRVSCKEPILTTTAPKTYPTSTRSGNNRPNLFTLTGNNTNYRLILGIVAALLFLLIVIAVIVITVKYNRHKNPMYRLVNVLSERKISHYMMHKYSKRNSNGGNALAVSRSDNSVTKPNAGYLETHFDTAEEAISGSKPTAHIPPQLSINEKLNKVSSDETDLKLKMSSAKYSSFESTYMTQPVSESDSGESDTTVSKHSGRSDTNTPSSDTSSAPSVRHMSANPSNGGDQVYSTASAAGPRFEDIWVRVNSPDGTPVRRVSLGSQCESDRLLMSRPPTVLSFTSEERTKRPAPPIPIMQRSEDSRTASDDEEMDIKFVNPMNTPRRALVNAVKPALKYANPSSGSSTKTDSVKFSDEVHQSTPGTQYGKLTPEQQRKQRLKAAILQYPTMPSSSKPSSQLYERGGSQTRMHLVSQPDSALMVDLGSSQQRKSRSLPNCARRMNSNSNSTPASKRSKRKYASDNDKASSSSQEQLYPLVTNSSQRRASSKRGQLPEEQSMFSGSRERQLREEREPMMRDHSN